MPRLPKNIYRSNRESFLGGFKEHKNAFKTNSHTSNYAKHILDKSHSFGPIHNTMQIIQYHDKGAHLNTTERYYTKNNHLNDEHNISPNKIFDALPNPHQP
jgi:hypothetical protein